MTEREADIAATGFIMGLDVVCDALRDVQKRDDVPESVIGFIAGFIDQHEKGKEKLVRRMYQLMRKAKIQKKERI